MNQLALNFGQPRRRRRTVFYPTTPLSADQLRGAIATAEMQDEAVLAIFRSTSQPLAPSQVWRIGCDGGRAWLLTSVRRSINTLTNAGVLARTPELHSGPYGRPEHSLFLRMPA